MKRIVRHKTLINRLCRDERLNPNRRLLGELLLLWMDSEDATEKERIFKLIEAQYGTPQKTYWLEGDVPNKKNTVEVEATKSLKEFFSDVKEENGEVSRTDIHASSK